LFVRSKIVEKKRKVDPKYREKCDPEKFSDIKGLKDSVLRGKGCQKAPQTAPGRPVAEPVGPPEPSLGAKMAPRRSLMGPRGRRKWHQNWKNGT